MSAGSHVRRLRRTHARPEASPGWTAQADARWRTTCAGAGSGHAPSRGTACRPPRGGAFPAAANALPAGAATARLSAPGRSTAGRRTGVSSHADRMWPGRGRPSHDQAGAGARPKVLQPVRTTGTIRSDERNTTGCRDAPTCCPKRAIRMRASAGPPAQAQGIGAGNPASATASRTSDPAAALQSSSPSSSPSSSTSWLTASAAGRGRRLAGRLRIST